MVAATRDGACSTHATASAVVMCSKTTLEAGHPFDERRQDAIDEDLFAVENIDARIGDLTVDQKRQSMVGHRLEDRHHQIEIGDPGLGVGGSSRGVQLDSDDRVVF